MHKIQYIPMLAAALLVACNSGNSTSNTTVANTSPLAQYKAQLKYTAPGDNKNSTSLKNPADTRQQSFIAPAGGITLSSVRVTLFNSTNCSYGSESQLITMNGGAGVNFPAGTYTSTDASNLALAARFAGESIAAFAAQSVRFDYGYNAVGDGESGWVAANCIESGIGNFDPHPPVVCSDGQPCGFNHLQIVSLPESFVPAIFVSTTTFTGDLQGEAATRNPSGTFNGYTGADYLCQSDVNIPQQGAGSLWKALLSTNNATVGGISYYRPDYTTFIATATGGNLVGNNSLVNSISITYALVWTNSTSDEENCSNWTSNSSEISARYGVSQETTPSWYTDNRSPCEVDFSLYCVQQSN